MKLIKQPSESRVYAIDFQKLLASGDSVKTISSLTTSPAAQLTLSSQRIVTPKVLVRVQDGVAGTLYAITCIVTTTLGDTLEGEGELEVKNL